MRALYQLNQKIASFDFYSWMVLAKAMGYQEIAFDLRNPRTDKWNLKRVLDRFETIIKPGPALAGMLWRIGTEGTDPAHTDARHLIRFCREGGKIDRLRSVLPPADARYTVTLREEPRLPHRNSNIPAWREFAREIGARVIEDWHVEPIDLHARVALYAGAEMNFFVVNGPMHVCSLTDYPMMCFACNKCEGGFANTGIAFGEQYPWLRENQRLIWEDDTLDNLRRHFEAWRQRQTFAA